MQQINIMPYSIHHYEVNSKNVEISTSGKIKWTVLSPITNTLLRIGFLKENTYILNNLDNGSKLLIENRDTTSFMVYISKL